MKLLTILIMCGIFLGWFDVDSDHNHNVYVSGLPLDITVEEFVTLMGKCGIIMEDEKGRYGCVNIDKKYVGGERRKEVRKSEWEGRRQGDICTVCILLS